MKRLGMAVIMGLLVLSGCDGADPTTTPVPADTGTAIEAHATDQVETVTLPPDSVVPTTSIGGDVCAGGDAGDLDGDGAADRIGGRHVDADSHSFEIEVCLATGAILHLPAMGNGDVLTTADLNGDGINEILDGGTTAYSAGMVVHTWIDDGFVTATGPDGEPFWLSQGLTGTATDEGFSAEENFGCEVIDGMSRVVTGHVERTDNTVTVEVEVWRLDGAVFAPVDASTQEVEDDRELWEILADHVPPPCLA